MHLTINKGVRQQRKAGGGGWGCVRRGRRRQQCGRLEQQRRVRGEGDSGSLVKFGLEMSELEYGKGEELEGYGASQCRAKTRKM